MKIIEKVRKFKENIIAGVMAVTIVVNPFFTFSRQNKNKRVNWVASGLDAISNFFEDEDEKVLVQVEEKNYLELVNDVESVYNFDVSDVDMSNISDSLENNTNCNSVYELDLSDAMDVYNMTNDLIDSIKKNSETYLNEHSEYISAFYEKIDDVHRTDKIMTQTILKKSIKDILKDGNNKDICLIENLKFIISYDKSSNSENNYVYYLSEDNLIIVYLSNIRNSVSNENEVWNVLEYSVQCQLNEIRHCNCKCQNEKQTFPYITISDAATVSELYNSGKSETLVSNLETKNESLILMLGLFNKNASIYDYYNTIFNNDLKSFYDFCGVNNDESMYKLNKILYAMDLINGKNSLGENIDKGIGSDYRVNLFGMIISNMITYTLENQNFSLKDNLILYDTIKNIMITDFEVLDNDDALENVITLNNLYIEFLSNYYEKTVDSIKEMENSEDIINYVQALINLCCKNFDFNCMDYSYTLYACKIVQKFPLLRQILINYDITALDYQTFINNNLDSYNSLVRRIK